MKPRPKQNVSIHPEKKVPEAIRILLVDDHAIFRENLRGFLASYPDLEVVGEAENGEEAIRCVEMLAPSIVLMDINMPRLGGIEATARIKQTHPHVVVLGLSMNADEDHRDAMTAAGAIGLISKADVVERLYDEIITSLSGQLCAASMSI
jgi:DNA-binding NarL/FixJ family response regulator